MTPRSHFAFGCGAAPGPLALAGVLAWMLLRRRRAALLALPALGAESAKPRLTFMGLSAGGGVTDEAARSLAEYTQSELAGTRVYDVTSTSDLEKILGVERQKQLLGCSESSESCMAEIAGALNSDRLLSGSVQRADDTLIVNLSLIDPKSARVIGRAFRRVESPGGLKPVIEAIPGLVYELVNQEPRLEGRTVRPPRTFSGLMLGVLGAVDFLGFGAGGTSSLPISPGIVLEYAGRYFGGALTVLPKVDFGARLEARYYPLVLKNVLRPHLAAGSTLMLSGASVRGALGATLRVEAFVAFLDVGYERFFNFQAPPGPAGQFVYSQNAVVGGLGVGWLF